MNQTQKEDWTIMAPGQQQQQMQQHQMQLHQRSSASGGNNETGDNFMKQQSQQRRSSQHQHMNHHQQQQNQQPQPQTVQYQMQQEQLKKMQLSQQQTMQQQQLQLGQMRQHLDQMSRQTSASSHQSIQHMKHQMSRRASTSSHTDYPPFYAAGAGASLSHSSMRPPSTQPLRPPSRPSSQFSQGSAQSSSTQQNALEFPAQTFYQPRSTSNNSKNSNQTGEVSASSVQHVAFNDNISTYPKSAPHLASMAGGNAHPDGEPLQQVTSELDLHQTTPAASAVKKTAPRRNPVQHNSPLTYEEVGQLARSCTTEQQIVWVAKQILGIGNLNGFQKAASTMQRMKRQRTRSFRLSQKEGAPTLKDGSSNQDEEEQLKLDTFNVRAAKRMQAEMRQGLQFCNLMQEIIYSIIAEIDPENPVLLVQPPLIGTNDDFTSMPTCPTSTPGSGRASASHEAGRRLQSNQIESTAGISNARSESVNIVTSSSHTVHDATASTGLNSTVLKVPESPSAARRARQALGVNHEAETVAEGNPNGSTLRKMKKRGSTKPADPELLKIVSDQDRQGKKLSKKELGYRLFEATRFRSLRAGDYVAAKIASHDLWILARVVKPWNTVATYSQMSGLTEAKRDALFKEKVFIKDNDDANGDTGSTRAVNRQHVLPLPRSYDEAGDWTTRIRKGHRVYAMYPNTTALYCGSVIDSTTYCRNQDEIIVVEFDSDEDDNGTTPHRHIPSRFVTLIPRDFPASQIKKKKIDGGKKRGRRWTIGGPCLPRGSSTSGPSSSQPTSVDDMLLGMYEGSGSSVLNYDDMVFTSTPRSTPPPAEAKPAKVLKRKKSQTKRGSKKQKGELASSHFV